MQITKVDNARVQIGDETVFVSDLIAALAATVGPREWLQDLRDAHLEMSHALHNQNFPDVGSEPYDATDPEVGIRLENLAGAIANALTNLANSNTTSC